MNKALLESAARLDQVKSGAWPECEHGVATLSLLALCIVAVVFKADAR